MITEVIRLLEDLRQRVTRLESRAPAGQNWIAPTLLNSWVNNGGGFNSAGYYKDALGIVHLRGFVKDGTLPGVIFTLPAGYRPAAQFIVAVLTNPNAIGRCDVLTTGDVRAEAGSNVNFSIDCISFRPA